MFKRNLYIYQKIIIVFTLMLGPVYIISVLINIQGSNYLQKEISNSLKLNTSFYSKHLNNQFEYIKTQQQIFINDSSVQNLNFYSNLIDSFDTVKCIKDIQERTSVIKNSSNYIRNAGVIIKSVDKTISYQSGVMSNPNYEYNLIKECLTSEKSDNSIYFSDGRIFMIEFFPVMKPEYNTAKIISYLEFDKKSLTEFVKQMTMTKNSGTFLVDKDFNLVVSYGDSNHIIDSINDREFLKSLESNDEYKLIKKIGKDTYWITCSKVGMPNMVLISYIPAKEITGPLNKYGIWFAVLSVVSLIVILIFSFSVNIMIHKPMSRFVDALKEIETDNLDIRINYRGNNEFEYIYKGFNNMVIRLKNSIWQNYEQKIALHQSELKQLQAQINPHFLYNSFFSIYRMCKCEDYENVAYLTQKLGSYYQYITRSGADEVPLYMEFKHSMDYVDIQSVRFSKRIKVHVDKIPEEYKNLMVPKIIIQPVIENAYEHAFENRIHEGNIYIYMGFADNSLIITVEDDGDPIDGKDLRELQEKLADTSSVKEKTGIVNVCRRIRLKHGDKSGITAERSKYGGLKFTISINYQEDIKNV